MSTPDPAARRGRLRSVAAGVARRFPAGADAARRSYFALANSPAAQRQAYRQWLAERRPELPNRPGSVTAAIDASTGSVTSLLEQLAIQHPAPAAVVVYGGPSPVTSLPVRHEAADPDWMSHAVEQCGTDFLCFLTADDVLYPDSFAQLADALAAVPDAVLVYGGEDVAVVTGGTVRRRDPLFKPAWNPEMLSSGPYVGQVTWLRTEAIRHVGGFDPDASEPLWDLYLRMTDRDVSVAAASGIVAGRRRPWWIGPSAAQETISAALTARGQPPARVTITPAARVWSVAFELQGNPLVSIVIPSKNNLDVVKRCVDSIYQLTDYRHFEVVLVDTGSDDPAVWQWYGHMTSTESGFRVLEWPEQPWSYARSCNAGAEAARGEVLVMLNNDTEVVHADWLQRLVAEAQQPQVGVVGCWLMYPDDLTVQHAGIGLGIKTVAGNSLAGLRVDRHMSRTQLTMLFSRRATSAVTAACIALRADVYAQVGGFDPAFRVSFNDVDLSLRIGAAGYRVIYTPAVRLLHHESKSVAPTRDWDELRRSGQLLIDRWGALVADDPQFNPHLSRQTTSYRLPWWGR